MRRFVFLSFAFVTALSSTAQDTNKEKPATAWKTGGMFTLMGGQSGTRNWAPTGSEKLTFTGSASLNLFATKKWGKNTWDNTADLSYATVYARSIKTRKLDDKIDLYSKFSHSFANNLAWGLVGSLRTQFSNGYDFTETPKKRISGFFAPAYIVFSPGLQYATNNNTFGVHVGPHVRWVVVTNAPYSLNYQGGVKPDGTTERTLADLYSVEPGREVRVEGGMFLSALFKKEIVKNVTYRTRLDITSDVIEADNFVETDIYWTNTFTMSVNKWLKVNYSFDLYEDENVTMFGPAKNESRTQMRSLLGVGLGVSF
ncbi:MAG TPA: DUF3078 domain-containing protein [Flavisolibacter sp.]|nr:DUF3078 domain-containing protein [Flavisolibacter sp.]